MNENNDIIPTSDIPSPSPADGTSKKLPVKSKKTAVTKSTGKDPKTGLFVKGNKLGLGNPHGKKMEQLRSALYSCVTVADWKEIITNVVTKARKGDRFSIEFLADRLLGKALQTIDANITGSGLTVEQASEKINNFFGIKEVIDKTIDKDKDTHGI